MNMKVILNSFLFCFKLHIFVGFSNGLYEVDIAIIGYNNLRFPEQLGILAYPLPAYELAIEDMNRKYNGSIEFRSIILTETSIKSCAELAENAERLAAQWYYKEKPKPDIIRVMSGSGEKHRAF